MYKVKFDNKEIELPTYSISIAKSIALLDEVEGDIETKLRALYDFIASLIGEDKTKEVLKSFEEADPNMINILFLSIVNVYNKPLTDYKMQESVIKPLDTLNSPQVKTSLDAIDKIVKANEK